MKSRPPLADLIWQAGKLYDEYWRHTDIGYGTLNYRNRRDYPHLIARYRQWCMHGSNTISVEAVLLRREAKWYLRFYGKRLGRIKHLEHQRPLVSRHLRVTSPPKS